MNVARSLDHVGIAGKDLAALASLYQRLGFCLTPVAHHSGRLTPDGPVVPFGTTNRCAMLRRGYLELIAIVDQAAFTNSLEVSLARYAGIHIVALGVDDESANLARMRGSGIGIPGIAYLERPVDDRDPGTKARFARLPLPSAPEGRIFLIRHLTPEAIRPERFLVHRNHAVALAEVAIASESPLATAARFSLLSGLPVSPDPAGGFILTLADGAVRIVPPEDLSSVFPGAVIPALPFIAGIVIATDDGNAAIRRCVESGSLANRLLPQGLLVGAEEAGGVNLLFRAG